ncbi:MAG: hypothetical protein J7K68_00750 [Candidatus Diapherotrites archaeon]|nr:hypothetical protein [Candidatus Diapherotrites archaeon]
MDKKEIRSKLEMLKSDQEELRRQLNELDTYLTKKRARLPPRREERPRYEPRYREPYPYTRYEERETDELLRQNIEQSRKLMDKFDYLLDTLISSMEEVESENIDELIRTLAKTQVHMIDVLGSIRSAVEESKTTEAKKEELERLKEEQAAQYAELSKKINALMEKIETPSYLGELDAIRVSISSLDSELKKLKNKIGEGTPSGGGVSPDEIESLKNRLAALEERLSALVSTMDKIGTHMNMISATTAQIANMKKELERLSSTVSIQGEQLLAETDKRTQQIESEIAALSASVKALSDLEAKLNEANKRFERLDKLLSKMPQTSNTSEIADIKRVVSEIKEQLSKTHSAEAIESLKRRIDEMNKSLNEIKKKVDSSKINELEKTLVRLEKEISELKKKQ